eukprot:ANDGO_06140.mRNA.1 CSC1-like protein At4g35870
MSESKNVDTTVLTVLVLNVIIFAGSVLVFFLVIKNRKSRISSILSSVYSDESVQRASYQVDSEQSTSRPNKLQSALGSIAKLTKLPLAVVSSIVHRDSVFSLLSFFRVADATYVATVAGPHAAAYLTYQRILIVFMLVFTVLTCCSVLPANVLSCRSKKEDEFRDSAYMRTTIGCIDTDDAAGQQMMWVHATAACFCAAMAVLAIRVFQKSRATRWVMHPVELDSMMKSSQHVTQAGEAPGVANSSVCGSSTANRERVSDQVRISQYAVILSHLPSSIATSEDLSNWFLELCNDHFNGSMTVRRQDVVAATVVGDVRSLVHAVHFYENMHAKWVKAVKKEKQRKSKGKSIPKVWTFHPFDREEARTGLVVADAGATHQAATSRDQQKSVMVSMVPRRENAVEFWEYRMKLAAEAVREEQAKARPTNRTESASASESDVASGHGSASPNSAGRSSPSPSASTSAPVSNPKTKTKTKKEEKEKEMEKVAENPKPKAASRNSGFIILSSASLAATVLEAFPNSAVSSVLPLSMLASHAKSKHVRIHPAPEPSDIEWGHMGISKREKALRVFGVHLMLVGLLLFFSTPLAILHTLSELFGISFDGSNSGGSVTGLGILTSIVFSFVPSLLLYLISLILPSLIWFLTTLEGHRTYSQIQYKSSQRNFMYIVLSSLVLPTVAISLADFIQKYQSNGSSLESTVANAFLPESGLFFFLYVMQAAFVGSSLDLLRLGDAFVSLFEDHEGDEEDAGEAGELKQKLQRPEQKVEFEYPVLVSIVAVCLTYAWFTPLIVPVGLFYTACKHLVDQYHILHISQSFDKDAWSPLSDTVSKIVDRKRLLLCCRFLLESMAIALVYLFLFFSLRSLFPQASIILLGVFSTFAVILLVYSGTWKWTADFVPFSFSKNEEEPLLHRECCLDPMLAKTAYDCPYLMYELHDHF